MDGADNPFASPTSNDAVGYRESADSAAVFDRTVKLLARTRPWVAAVVVFGGIVFLVSVLGLFVLLMFATATNMGPREPWLLLMGMYGGMLALYGLPLVYLIRFARNIRKLTQSQDISYLEDAIDAQRKFWKCVGGFLLGSFVLFILFLSLSLFLTEARVG